ncbi:hypothetical protein KP509_21G048900 [Ceratopteris richardii]|nr:hypothetical protein KP509_21G048900 [Ceratopteris richardii]
MNDYALHYGKVSVNIEERRPIKTDQDTLRETYRFIRTEEDDSDNTWEQRLAKRYYDKLFKEYCIADMSHYKDGKIGMRWRSEKEVISGKGQFICGSKNCDVKEDLSSYEVNFTYREAGENKQALVKLRVCPRCGEKLNYRRNKDNERQKKDKKRSQYEERSAKHEKNTKRKHTEDVQHWAGDSSSSPSGSGGCSLAESPGEEEEDDKLFRGMFP